MRRWLIFLGGPLIWAAHFLFIYFVASVSEVVAGETSFPARALIVVSGIAAAICNLLLLFRTRRLPGVEPLEIFWRSVTATGAAISIIAIVWQSLPAFTR